LSQQYLTTAWYFAPYINHVTCLWNIWQIGEVYFINQHWILNRSLSPVMVFQLYPVLSLATFYAPMVYSMCICGKNQWLTHQAIYSYMRQGAYFCDTLLYFMSNSFSNILLQFLCFEKTSNFLRLC
jgi:hypothetical protein